VSGWVYQQVFLNPCPKKLMLQNRVRVLAASCLQAIA
jgi:hypothetical protein